MLKYASKLGIMFELQRKNQRLINRILQDFPMSYFAKKTKPPTFKLKDLNDEEIAGHFYTPELSKTVKDDVYRIKSVIRQRTRNGVKQLYVSWMGFPETENCWINESDIV
ncbi:putative transposon-derived protein F54H12.3 [Aphelenchoides besseyi]|nr:putative transposon-derived protein F54H12.3 [Aphelenchoides besseyi]